VATTVHPRNGKSLTTRTRYVDNLVFSRTDPYGRTTFNAYRGSDNALIRTVQATRPGVVELASFEDVLSLERAEVIRDVIRDVAGQTIATIDPRGVVGAVVYDSRGRTTVRIEAATTLPPYNKDTADDNPQNDGPNPADGELDPLHARTERDYDANSNVVQVRHPRWFDSSDINGRNRCFTTSEYTGRNLLKSRTVAAGGTSGYGASGGAGTMSYTYYLDGRNRRTTDYRGNVTETLWHQCCGRNQGSIDQAGHGTLSNTDFYGNVCALSPQLTIRTTNARLVKQRLAMMNVTG